ALTLVENREPVAAEILHSLWPSVGRAWRIGITGPPGAGKSTLVAAMIALLRKAGKSIGVVAVDPTSPFTGGALLGDRVRMVGAWRRRRRAARPTRAAPRGPRSPGPPRRAPPQARRATHPAPRGIRPAREAVPPSGG